MIPTTPYESEIMRRVQAGELCARVLCHGDFCGREIDKRHGLDLCTWHSEVELGLPHSGDAADGEPSIGPKTCTRCHKRPVAFKVTRLCGNCQKVTKRQHLVSNRRRETT